MHLKTLTIIALAMSLPAYAIPHNNTLPAHRFLRNNTFPAGTPPLNDTFKGPLENKGLVVIESLKAGNGTLLWLAAPDLQIRGRTYPAKPIPRPGTDWAEWCYGDYGRPPADRRPVVCGGQMAHRYLCEHLRRNLAADYHKKVQERPRQVCYVEGEDQCCTSWQNWRKGIKQGQLLDGIDRALRCDRNSRFVGATIKGVMLGPQSYYCTIQCVSRNPKTCFFGEFDHFTGYDV